MSSQSQSGSVKVQSVPSEDIVARKFDSCMADFIVNTGLGFSAGVVASVLLFRRRGWPVALSTGFGMGVAYQNCNISFNPYALPGTKILPQTQTSSEGRPPTTGTTASSLGSSLSSAFNDAKHRAESAVGKAKDTARDVKNDVKDKAREVKDAAQSNTQGDLRTTAFGAEGPKRQV